MSKTQDKIRKVAPRFHQLDGADMHWNHWYVGATKKVILHTSEHYIKCSNEFTPAQARELAAALMAAADYVEGNK